MKRALDPGTLIGLALGVFAIFGSFAVDGGSVALLVMWSALVVVFGGTFATLLIGNSTRAALSVGRHIMTAVRPEKFDYREIVEMIVRFSTIARKDGLLMLEKELSKVPYQFFKTYMQLGIDGTDAHLLRSLGEMEIQSIEQQQNNAVGLFQKMGGYSPTMGIIGTVLGLILALGSAGKDPDTLTKHIGAAFIATLWGVFMANLVWLPIADKLRGLHEEQNLQYEIMLEGIMSIQAGDNPLVTRARLQSMIPPHLRGVQ